MTPSLRAGVARTNLTPPVGISHGNWGAQTHARAAGVDLDLFGTALVLANGTTQVAIIDTEFCVVADVIARSIREAVAELTGIPFDHVRLSYTHTHSGPSLGPTWLHDGDEMVPAYVNSLPHRLAGAVWQAQQALQPARVAAASGSSAINVNRRLKLDSGRVVCGRNWDGFVDR
jgi:neutral ceramidase